MRSRARRRSALAAAACVLTGCGGDVELSSPTPASATATTEASLEGDWGATGKVIYPPEGTILERPWRFQEVCDGTCRIA